MVCAADSEGMLYMLFPRVISLHLKCKEEQKIWSVTKNENGEAYLTYSIYRGV